jgi:hypothetical protein
MSAMIDIEPCSWIRHPHCDRKTTLFARRSLPFVESSRGEYTHRVRHVTLHTCAGQSHFSVSCWCGMILHISPRRHGKLVAAPGEGRPICATCEGRVIGAGLVGSREIAGRPVMFRTRNAEVRP